MRALRAWLPHAVLVAAWALFFWRFAAPNPDDRLTFVAGDFSQQFGVFRAIAYRSLVSGQFPLWADCLYSGYPFHADPQAQLFYPPVWLVFGWLRTHGWGHFPLEALVFEAAAHYLLASLFSYWFLRSLRLRPSAAVLGALVFSYGGYLTGSPPLQTGILETVAWLPLALLGAGRLAENGRTRDLALTGLVLAVAYLAGHPQTFFYCAALTLAYFAWRAWELRWRAGAIAMHSLGLMALALALAGVQLVPSAHFIVHSTRATVSFEQAGHGFPLADIVQFFITRLVSYWNPLYVGILPLGLAILAVARRARVVRFWAVAALLGLILSFGTKAIAYDVVYWIMPGYRLFRSQERLALVVGLALAVLAAYGVEAVLDDRGSDDQRAVRRLIAGGVVLFAGGWVLLAALVYARQLALTVTTELVERAGLFTLATGLALLALGLAARLPGRAWMPAVLIGVAVIDLFAANRSTNAVPPYAFYPFNPLLTAIYEDDSFFRVQDDYQLAGHAGCAYGYRAVEGVAPYQVATYSRFMESAPEPVRWQLLGVRYVVTWRAELTQAGPRHQPIEVMARGDVPDDRGNVTTLHRLGSPPRRAVFVHGAEVMEGDDQLYARLAEPDFDPLTTVLLLQPAAIEPGTSPNGVRVHQDRPGRLSLTTETEAGGVLVVSEAYFPGWRAWVDGIATPVVRANGALLAIAMPAGRHQVELVYRPPALAAGGALSGVALVMVGLMLVSRGGLPGSSQRRPSGAESLLPER